MKNAVFVGIVFVVLFAASCGSDNAEDTVKIPEDKSLMIEAQGYFKMLPPIVESNENPVTGPKVALGKTLFYDSRLSQNNTQSCNSCHNLATFGVDNDATSKGDLGQNGGRNSPTVYNAAFHFAQFWDGRAKTIEDQAGMPILNPVEMNMPSEGFVVSRLKGINGYKQLFQDAFPNDKDPISYLNLKKAIGAFERTLTNPGRFDQYLGGDNKAITNEEKEGLAEFISVGCIQCHTGMGLGGNMMQKFPVHGTSYVSATGSLKEDLGKMEQTKDEFDKFKFKVPSLLNITETAPYFHDGSVKDLDKAISIMGKLQLNKDLSPEQIKKIHTFLNTLKGNKMVYATTVPVMPK
ncbi:MAG: c-type cytochrome [Bacteroidetes bacterium]|nr:c-type cytochrome [Bacteroidota bacterium]